LGAGASKSYELSKTKQKLPLANDFFRTFNNLEISKNGWVLVGDIINYVKDKRSISPFAFTLYNEDIEQLHSEIQLNYLDAIKKDDFEGINKYGNAYNQLVFLFSSVINEIQNGGESEFHKNLVLGLNDDDSIITFNWDTLIDKSLKYNKSWSTKDGYYIRPKMIYRDRWIEGENGKTKNFLLKLHGSTNWISSYIHYDFQAKKISFDHAGPENTFYVYEKTQTPYPCYDGRYMAGYEDFSMGYYPPNLPLNEKEKEIPDEYLRMKMTQRFGFNPRGKSKDEGVASMPIIIPPVKNKSYDFYGDLFPKLWKKAKDILREADKIYILGYSFPATDIPSNDLFKKAFIKRKTIPDIVIVNPHPDEIRHKFNYVFGIPDNKLKVYGEYITKDYIIPT